MTGQDSAWTCLTIFALANLPTMTCLAWGADGIAPAVETSLYAYIVVGFGLSQAYSPMLYFLVAVSRALPLQVEHRLRPAVARLTTPFPETGTHLQ